MKNTFSTLIIFLAVLIGGSTISQADLIQLIGDDTNNFSTTINGITIEQPSPTTSGQINISSGHFFNVGGVDFTQLGNGSGVQPGSLVTNSTLFQITDTNSVTLFDARLTFLRTPQGANSGGIGTPPDPFNNAGFVLDLQPVPEPSSTGLLTLALIMNLARRKRRVA